MDPVVVTPTNGSIYTALGTSAILAAQQANSALLTHLAEMQIGSGSPQVATVLGTTTPTQTAFTGTASALDDLLPALPQAVGAMGGWFKGIGSFDNLTGSGNIPGFATQAGGFLMGLDRVLAQNLTGGIALGYLHTNVSEDTGSYGTIDTPRVSVYGSYSFGNLAIDATAGYGYDF